MSAPRHFASVDLFRCVLILVTLAPASVSCRPATPERIVIGSTVTDSARLGLELALEEIQAEGGIDGVPLEMETPPLPENGSPPTEVVVQWASSLTELSDLVAVVGTADSTVTLASTPIYQQRGVPSLVTSATTPAVTRLGDWIYRLCLSDTQQGEALARYAVETWGTGTIAVIYANDPYGRGLAEIFEGAVESLGARVVSHTFHHESLRAADRELIRRGLARLATEPPNLIALFHSPESAAWTLELLAELGIEAPVLGGETLANSSLAVHYPDVSQLRAARFYQPNPAAERTTALERQFVERFGRLPRELEVYAYDAIHLLGQAMREEEPSREGIRRYLDRAIAEARTLEGASGTWRLDPDRNAIRPLHIVEWAEGMWRPVDQIRD